ncbi:MAG: ABC transporter ATP-binding protein [Saprospiraceae bacterium]|nr:ABC transporter ATP-binding protein [Saprospiraceae bacterium]
MLEINELQKTYRNGVKALDQVTLSVGRGMLGLLGPNGAGKSTLMRTLATLQTPDSGRAFFDGIDILKNPVELRKLLGYLPQDFGVYPGISAQKLLDYFAILKGITAKKDRRRVIEEVLEITNLSDVAGKNVDGFSGGMKQRFGIAQLLLNNPKFIIVDEPTAGLDPAERNRFLNLLREISVENTVVFSTHIVEDINDLCSQVAILHRGKILLHESPSQAIDDVSGKIWTATIDKIDLEVATSKYMVLATKYNSPLSLTIRVFSENQPSSDFTPAEPQLEDVYFAALAMNGHPTAQLQLTS